MRKAMVFVFMFIITAVLIFADKAWAQTETGQISGTILDPQGNAVPSAKITIRNTGTGAALDSERKGEC